MGGAPFENDHRLSWRVTRLSLIFMLDIVRTVSGAEHPLDPMILSVVAAANAGLPADAPRRPVPINAIAAATGMAFETVRRRIHKLAEAGFVELTARGVIQHSLATTDPAYQEAANARYDRAKRFYFDLKAAGCLPDLPPIDRASLPHYEDRPLRIANRAVSDYSLRVIDGVVRLTGSPLRGLTLLHVARANGEHLDIGLFDHGAPLPDELRKPVSRALVARRMGLPTETARRHLQALVDLGIIQRIGRGYAMSAVGILTPEATATAQGQAENLRRLFARLTETGVLAFWDEEAAAGSCRKSA